MRQMKNLLLSTSVFALLVILTSCSGPKKAAEPQVANPPAETKVVAEPQKAEETKTATGISADDTSNKREKVTGSEIIGSFVSRMKNKLLLREDQIPQVESILTKTFTDSGEKLENVYDAAVAKELGKSTVAKSADAIMAILDESQKATFTKFMKQ